MSDLILIPTELEQTRLLRLFPVLCRRQDAAGQESSGSAPRLALVGFGLVAAAARTMQLLQQHRPSRVWLVGIAGSLRPELPVGGAVSFSAVSVDGIGVGWQRQFQAAAAIGWQQWPGDATTPPIGDRLSLAVAPLATAAQPASEATVAQPSPEVTAAPRLLLSVTAAAQDADHAAWRRMAYPDASAEDMEGFAVATACALAGVPCHIIRGISNQAGDRDLRRWQFDTALAAAGQLLVDQIGAF